MPAPGDIVTFTRPSGWSAETLSGGHRALASVARSFGDLTGIGPSNEQFLV